MHKTVLITGGSGFVAPHLISQFPTTWEWIVHVNRPNPENGIKLLKNCSIVVGPLCEKNILPQLPKNIDAAIHLAGAVNGSSIESILDSNIITTQNILRIMELRQIPKIIFMSTASVWSDFTGAPLSEETVPNPSTLYGYSKLAAERLIEEFVKQKKINSAVIFRCNNTYGPGCTQGAVANFKQALLNNTAIQIEGDGQQLREPLYITDLINVIMKSFYMTNNGIHRYAISGPEALTILQMARSLAEVLDKSMRVEWKPENPERARHIVMNTQKAFQELGWYPTVNYATGVMAMMRGGSAK